MRRVSVARTFMLPALALAAGCQTLPAQLPYSVTDNCTVQRVAAAEPPGSYGLEAAATLVAKRTGEPLHLASAAGVIAQSFVAASSDDVQPPRPRPGRGDLRVPTPQRAIDDVRPTPPRPSGDDVARPPSRPRKPFGFGFGFGFGLPEPAPAAQPDIGQQLMERGPHFPAVFSMSCVPVHGFVRGGWPVVVDYLPGRDSDVALEVHVPGRSEPHVLPLDSTARRHLVRLVLPPALGETPTVALLLVRAAKRDGSGAGGLRLYGLGAGPKAVGSVAIDQVNFRPGQIHVSENERASYSFFSRSDFNRTVVEILRVQRRDEEIRVSLARARPLDLVVNRGMWVGKTQLLTWDGFDGQRRVSTGVHLLQVRAWLNAQDEHDWVAAWSPDMVLVAE
jgi:hypothetical protein